jgi:hypothetical protein
MKSGKLHSINSEKILLITTGEEFLKLKEEKSVNYMNTRRVKKDFI